MRPLLAVAVILAGALVAAEKPAPPVKRAPKATATRRSGRALRALIQAGKVRGFFRLPLDILNAGWDDPEFGAENEMRSQAELDMELKAQIAALPQSPQATSGVPAEAPKPADQQKTAPEDSSTRVVKLP